MTHTITLIPGDGIGPEITAAVARILKASGVSIEWEKHLAGARAFERGQTVLPVELLDSIRRNQVALKAGKGIANPSVLLLSAVLMLRYIGEVAAADRIMALGSVLTAGDVRTRDLGGTGTTTELAGAICRTLETADELGAVHV